MLNQIRVVSTKCPFPVWINNQPIHLKLSKPLTALLFCYYFCLPHSFLLIMSLSSSSIFFSLFPSYLLLPPSSLPFPPSLPPPLSPPPPVPSNEQSPWLILAKDAFVNLHILPSETAPGDIPMSPQPPFRSESSLSEESNQSIQNQQPSFSKSNESTRPHPQFQHRITKSDVNVSSMSLCHAPSIDRYDSLSTNDGDIERDEEEGFIPKLFSSSINVLGSWLQRNKSPDSDASGTASLEPPTRSSHLSVGSPQDGERPPLSQRSLSPSRSSTSTIGGGGGGGHGHVKQHSWSGQSEFELPEFPPVASLPLRLSVRVQTLKPEVAHKVWGQDNVFDIYVHPLSLPHHLYNHYLHHGSSYNSFLVRVTLVCPPPPLPPPPPKSSGKEKQPLPDSTSSTSLVSNKSSFFERLTNYVTDVPDRSTPSPTPPTPTSTPPPSEMPVTISNYYCKTILAHMHIVTHLVTEQRRLSMLSHTIEEVSQSREASNSPGHSPASVKREAKRIGGIPVLPGHAVLGGLVCQQLGAHAHSYVLIEEVKEEWRIDVKRNKVSVTLDPVAPIKVSTLYL